MNNSAIKAIWLQGKIKNEHWILHSDFMDYIASHEIHNRASFKFFFYNKLSSRGHYQWLKQGMLQIQDIKLNLLEIYLLLIGLCFSLEHVFIIFRELIKTTCSQICWGRSWMTLLEDVSNHQSKCSQFYDCEAVVSCDTPFVPGNNHSHLWLRDNSSHHNSYSLQVNDQ